MPKRKQVADPECRRADVLSRCYRNNYPAADGIATASSRTVETLEYIRRMRRSDSAGLQASISELRQLAGDIDASEPLLRQQARVRQFFERSAEALRRLANG